ncbi:MAG TPA: hypothetical protein VIT85_02075 [Solirubrobacterales bacterium]
MRPKLTYANVLSTLVVFVALAGGTAFAAAQLAKNSVGKKQLKANAVTTAKIKKNAVTNGKIKKNAVNGAKVADGSITSSDIDAANAPFSYIAQRIRGSLSAPFVENGVYPVGSYTQPANEDNQFLVALNVNFSDSCAPPREAEAYLMLDAADPSTLDPTTTIGLGIVDDTSGGSVTKRLEFAPYPFLYSPMSRTGRANPTPHTFTAFLGEVECASGSGVSVLGSEIDVVGTK